MSFLQLVGELVQRDTLFHKQNKQMIEQLRCLGDQFIGVLVLRCDDCFSRLFADFLQDLIEPTVEEIGCVAVVGAFFLPSLNQLV
jgi:hypothetical protein